jgi:ubiquinone/menaquinone biosynthesis C-methylase UbiE
MFNWLFKRLNTLSRNRLATPQAADPIVKTMDSRRYVENSEYLLPKDDEEDLRLNFQHHVLYHAIGNHYVAPVPTKLQAILDVGTGTGIWAHEMALLYPSALVVGVDMDASSFKQATLNNCMLRLGNIVKGLPFPDEFFSYTHQRMLVLGISAANWPGVIHELVRVTRVNGWVELIEIDNVFEKAGPAVARLQEVLDTLLQKLGFDAEIIHNLGNMLKQEGLQSVDMFPIKIPVGDWGGSVGTMLKKDILAVAQALKVSMCQAGGMSPEEYDQLLQAVANEWEAYRSTYIFYAVYGKRVL